jgi:N-acetylglutamate synthase-like GNAT family acetyltransferase
MTNTSTPKNNKPLVEIRHDLRPGDIGTIIDLHDVLYAKEYGFDHTFEPYVAKPLAEFVKSQTARERIWIAEQVGKIAGSIAIVKSSDDEAQLRWLLLHPDVRGFGFGRALIEEAVAFCRTVNYSSVFLWTVSILTIATKLYQSVGFRKTEEKTRELWGTVLTEEHYELILK